MTGTYSHRVRYDETGGLGAAHYARICGWFDAAQQELLRADGFSYGTLAARGFGFAVVDVHLSIRCPARCDEQIVVKTTLRERKYFRFAFHHEIFGEDGRKIAVGDVCSVFVNRQMRPVNMAKALPEAYEAYGRYLESAEALE